MAKYHKHETAIIEENCIIGDDTNIWHFSHIRKGARIGKNCNFGKDTYIDTDVKIGDNVKIQNSVSVWNGVTIENNAFIGPGAVFTNDLYPRSMVWIKERIKKTLVKEGASIGANATILCNDLVIGRYAMVGAGSVVTKNVPDHALVVGNPAKIVGYVCECGNKIIYRTKTLIKRCDKCGLTAENIKKNRRG